MQTPSVSLVIRSFNRVETLLELLNILSKQEGTPFEIIVIEQSGEQFLQKMEAFKALQSIFSSVRIIKENNDELFVSSLASQINQIDLTIILYPALGGPEARNKGVLHAKGSIIILLDDDDLPCENDWVYKHQLEHMKKPNLIALTGRQILKINESNPYLLSKLSKSIFSKFVMSYSVLKTPYTNARYDQYVNPVKWVHGTNSSIKKEWIEKVNGWDSHMKNQDEHTFAFKIASVLKDSSSTQFYFEFNPSIVALRRTDIEGGMAKRTFSIQKELRNQWNYISKVVYKYFPIRVIMLFPFYVIFMLIKLIQKSISQISKPKSSNSK